jgi:hypothetical protein
LVKALQRRGRRRVKSRRGRMGKRREEIKRESGRLDGEKKT